MTTLSQFKLFWLWEDEKEEAWLRSMAQQGWHFQQVRLLNRYIFEAGTPQDIVYRLDWYAGGKDYQSYLQLFKDAGWEHVEAYGSWQYFRKASMNGIAPEIFTDADSKIKKYQRILLLLFVFLILLRQPTHNSLVPNPENWLDWVYAIGFVLRLGLFVLILISGIMLAKRIKELQKRL